MASEDNEDLYDVMPAASENKNANFSLLKKRFEKSQTLPISVDRRPESGKSNPPPTNTAPPATSAPVPGVKKMPVGAVPLLPQKSFDKPVHLVPQGSVDRTARKQSIPQTNENSPPLSAKGSKEFLPPSSPPPPLPGATAAKPKPLAAPKPQLQPKPDASKDTPPPRPQALAEKTQQQQNVPVESSSVNVPKVQVGEIFSLPAGTVIEYAGKKYRSLPLPDAAGQPPKRPALPPNVVLPPMSDIVIFDLNRLPETQDVKPKLGTPPNKSPPPQVEVEEIFEDEELYSDVVNEPAHQEIKPAAPSMPPPPIPPSPNRVSELIYEDISGIA